MLTRTLLHRTAFAALLVAAVIVAGRLAAPTARAQSAPTVSVVGATARGTYTGPCPPPAERAPSFQAVITVPSGPTNVTYRWLTGSGGSSDPTPKTLHFPGTGRQHAAITFIESGYLPDQTLADWVAVYVSSPLMVKSNHMGFTTTCHSGRPHRLDPASNVTDMAPVR